MGKLYVVATPIGNLNDFTNRAIEVLQNVHFVASEDTRTSSVLLKHFNINTKLVSYHKFNEKAKSQNLIDELLNGKDIALISDAGCPCISDPGSILVKEAIKNKIEVIGIPGASATTTSLMVSGMNTESFTFYGFLNREKKKMQEQLERIKRDSSNVAIIYESPKRIIKTLEMVLDVLDNPNICLCNDLTKKFEKKYYGPIDEVIKALKENSNYELGEYVLLIEKPIFIEDKEEESIEALIVDVIIKNKCTMKEAIKMVSEKYHIGKNEVYNKSLNIKKIFEK